MKLITELLVSILHVQALAHTHANIQQTLALGVDTQSLISETVKCTGLAALNAAQTTERHVTT